MRILTTVIAGVFLAACGSSPDDYGAPIGTPQIITPAPGGGSGASTLALPDQVSYYQKDPRWGGQTLGGSGESLSTDGCVVTAAAMAMSNLGVAIDPGQLNAALKQNGGYTNQGWLVWDGIRKVSGGRVKATYHDQVNAGIIDSCLSRGEYPLTRFILPNGRTHWAMIVRRSSKGYHMRDPLHPSKSALLFPRGADAFKAVRCIGRG